MKLKEVNSHYKFNKDRLKQWLINKNIIDLEYIDDIYDLDVDSSLVDLMDEEKKIIETTPIRKKFQKIDEYVAPDMIPMEFRILNLHNTVILDTETTGLYKDDEVIELSVIDMLGRELYHSLFRPTKKMGRAAARVTGISNPLLKDEPLFKDEWRKIKRVIGNKTIIGHNINFDYRITMSTAMRYGIPVSEVKMLFGDMIDSMEIAKRYVKNQESYKLADLCKHFGIVEPQKHRATYDCLQTLQVLRAIETKLLNSGYKNHGKVYSEVEVKKEKERMKDVYEAIIYGYKANKSIEDLSIFYGVSKDEIASLLLEKEVPIRIDEEKKRRVELIASTMKEASIEELIAASKKYAESYEVRLILGK